MKPRFTVLAVVVLAASAAVLGTVASPGGGTSTASELPYLLYLDDRDGDEEVYGVRADGRRTVQISRDRADFYMDETVLSPDGRWVYLSTKMGRELLVSTDGRQSHRLPGFSSFGVDCPVVAPTFSPDSRLFVFGEDEDCMQGLGRMRIVPLDGGKPRVLAAGLPWSFAPRSRLLAVLEIGSGRDEMFVRGVRFLDLTTGKSLGLAPTGFEAYEVGWSPDGRFFAVGQGRTLRVVDVQARPLRARVVARLKGDFTAGWLDSRRISYELWSEESDSWVTGVVSVAPRVQQRTVAPARVDWSADGTRAAYVTGKSPKLAVVTVPGTGRRVVFRAATIEDVDWTSNGDVLVSHGGVVTRVEPSGKARNVYGGRRPMTFVRWSPNGKFIEVRGTKDEVGVLRLDTAPARVVWLPVVWRFDHTHTLAWVPGSAGPARAKPPPAPSPVERASGSRLQSSGKVAEIAASGMRVAAIVGESRLDCHHVLAWTAGTSRVVRFEKRLRCDDGGDRYGNEALVAISLDGTTLRFIGESWGNFSYWTYYRADTSRPGAGIRATGSGDGDHGDEPGRPPPERVTRNGVSVEVKAGTIVLVRQSDGRMRTIRPPGGAVDAELENAGLFYAYNAKAAMPGTIQFVPFAKLFP